MRGLVVAKSSTLETITITILRLMTSDVKNQLVRSTFPPIRYSQSYIVIQIAMKKTSGCIEL